MWVLLGVALAAPVPDIDEPLRTGLRAPGDAAVVVGLEDYLLLPDVPHARRDAQAMADFLISTRGVPMDQVQLLTSGSKEQIVAAVERAARSAEPGGTVWVYFAGHGVAAPSDGRRLLLGDDARQAAEVFEARGVAVEDLEDLATSGGARAVILVDACFNGASRSGEAVVEGTRFAVPDWATQPSDQLHWAAAGPDQVARPLDVVQHGAFTWLAIGALRGWADGEIDGQRDGQVTAAEAQVYVSRAMRTLGLHDQQPVLTTRNADGWVLSQGATEPPPELPLATRPPRAASSPIRHLQLVAAPPPLPQGPEHWYEPSLLEAAAAYQVTLPVRSTLFGYRDAEEQRVRRNTYMALVKHTPHGRRALGTRTAGLLLAAGGWAGTMGFATGAVTQDKPKLIGASIGSFVAMLAGVGMTVGAQSAVNRALEPHPPKPAR